MNVKKKGNAGENNFANWLTDNGIKGWRDGQSGGGNREKADVGNNIDCHFEVKTVKNLSLRKAWRQAVKDAEKTQNTPYVAVHFDGMAKNEWLMVTDNWSWLNLILKEDKNKVEPEINTRDLKWKKDKAIYALKELIKELEN